MFFSNQDSVMSFSLVFLNVFLSMSISCGDINSDLNPYIILPFSPKYTYRTHLSSSINLRCCSTMADLKVPLDKQYPSVYLEFDILPLQNWGKNVKRMVMRAMANAGYVVEIEISDPEGAMMSAFIEQGYFESVRTAPLEVTFAFLSGVNMLDAPDYGTLRQRAFVTYTDYYTPTDDRINISFTAIDPVSYTLSMGDASGKCYRGRLDEVISQVVTQYAPGIEFKMDRTNDSSLSRYWMLRQDPKSFITSMLEWSSPLNQTKTNWVVQVDDYKLEINQQGSMISKKRGYYSRYAGAFSDSIASSDVIANNALNVVATKLVSPGASAFNGDYLDRVTDQDEKYTVAKDVSTPKKQVPEVEENHGFQKPLDDPEAKYPHSGMTHVIPIPEYTCHELGLDYRDYIDGRGREHYLQLLASSLKTKLVVKGHGEYINTFGLGVDTIYVDWNRSSAPDDPSNEYWMQGAWIVYGFEHTFKSATWYTTLYVYRPDQNAVGKKIS